MYSKMRKFFWYDEEKICLLPTTYYHIEVRPEIQSKSN